jgi:hypothetical protein
MAKRMHCSRLIRFILINLTASFESRFCGLRRGFGDGLHARCVMVMVRGWENGDRRFIKST